MPPVLSDVIPWGLGDTRKHFHKMLVVVKVLALAEDFTMEMEPPSFSSVKHDLQ